MPTTSHELLPLVVQENNVLIDATILHQKLCVKTRFNDWISYRLKDYCFKEGEDYFTENSVKSTAGRRGTNYLLTIDMAKELAMLERNEVGRAIRQYFIAKEKELRGRPYLPPQNAVFKQVPATTLNNRQLYQYAALRLALGYNTKTSTHHYRNQYSNHFIAQGGVLYCSQAFATHLYHQRQVYLNRKVLKAMPGVLNFDAALTSKQLN